MNHLGVVLLLWLAPLRLDSLPAKPEAWISRGNSSAEITMLQQVTDDLRGRLQIAEQVQVELIDHNPLVMSVETLGGRTGPFVISVDREFIHGLNPSEAEAVGS